MCDTPSWVRGRRAENVCRIEDKEREIVGKLTREESNPNLLISAPPSSFFSDSIDLYSQDIHPAYAVDTLGQQQLRFMDLVLTVAKNVFSVFLFGQSTGLFNETMKINS